MAILHGKKRGSPLNPRFHKALRDARVELVVRCLLGGVFCFASIHKIASPADFARIIYGYDLFPLSSVNLIAVVLPFLELVAGLALILGIYPRSASLIINFMLFTFVIAISTNLIRGHEFDCGCFSFGDHGSTRQAVQLLVRDVVLLFLGLHVTLFKGKRIGMVRRP
jgi:uncharacterized membrane protein YphA (DoxX/SURF4 family)